MNVTRIRLRNFRSYEALDLLLPDGPTAIIGVNGAGKSSILTAIDVGLFGARSLDPYLRHGGDRLLLELEFEHDGQAYRVRRSYAAGKSALDFEFHGASRRDRSPDTWEPLTLGSQKETQALLEQTIGLTRDTFHASAYLAQGDADTLTTAKPAERMATFRNTIGGLDVYDRAHQHTRTLIRDADRRLDELAGGRATLYEQTAGRGRAEEALTGLASRAVDALATLNAAEERLKQARAASEAAHEEHAHLRAAKVELDSAEAQLEALELRAGEAQVAATMLAYERSREEPLAAAAARVPELEARVQAIAEAEQRAREAYLAYTAAKDARDVAFGRRADLLGRASELNELAHRLREEAVADEQHGPGESVCRECRQTLGAEALASSVAARRVQADDLDAAARDVDAEAALIELPKVPDKPEPLDLPDMDPVVHELAVARRAERDLAVCRARIEQLDGTVDRGREAIAAVPAARRLTEEKDAAHQAANAAAGNLPMLRGASIAALEAVSVARDTLEQVRRAQAVTRADLERITLAERQLDENHAETARVCRDLDVLKRVADAFAPTGIPLDIISAAVPILERRAQEVLEQLGGQTASCWIECRTQRANKTDGALRDTLDFIVHAPDGETRPYELWSGGERMRLDLALSIGLAQLLLTHGANVELFAVDEPDGLDAQGCVALAEVVHGMADRYGFRKSLLVTHDDTLRDSFPQTITVSRGVGGGSAIAGEAAA